MRKLADKTTFTIEEASVHKFYGAQRKFLAPYLKAFITSDRDYVDEGNTFNLRDADGLTFGNRYGYHDQSLAGILGKIKRSDSWDIYEFDTVKELFDWLTS
jgi:hypothetical protein